MWPSSGSFEVAFACRAADHQRPHGQETREDFADRADDPPRPNAGALQQILIEHEKWLDRLHLPITILQDEIAIVEPLQDGVLDDFVIAVVFADVGKHALPCVALFHLCTGGDTDGGACRLDVRG